MYLFFSPQEFIKLLDLLWELECAVELIASSGVEVENFGYARASWILRQWPFLTSGLANPSMSDCGGAAGQWG
jgi:hypothetical protein